KGTKRSNSSAAKAPHSRRFKAKAVEEHGLKWFNAQKEAKCALKNWIDDGCLALEYPTIHATICELGLGYVFVEPEDARSFNAFVFMPVVDSMMYAILSSKSTSHAVEGLKEERGECVIEKEGRRRPE
ncbi:hypothetical protein HAX54_031757, partial [Datura stramonium]|nr:hypothetical protein [Datura stramonium]